MLQWLKLDQNNREMLWVRKLCLKNLTDHFPQLPSQWLIPAPCCEWTSETPPNSRNLIQTLHFLLIHLFITVLHSQALSWAKGNAVCSSAVRYLLSATCWHMHPHSRLPNCGTTDTQVPLAHGLHSNPKHTHAQRTESTHPGEVWVLEFNEVTGQTMLAGLRAWPDKSTDQHRQLASYILLHSLRLLLPASHNEFHPPGQGISQIVCAGPPRATSLWSHPMSGVDAPGTALGGWSWCSHLWLGHWDSTTALCPHASLYGKGWPLAHALTNTSTTRGKHFYWYWIKAGCCLMVIYSPVLIQQK